MSTTLEPHIGIFWDYENCRPPSNISGAKLVENICRLVRGSGAITQFKAYVDVSTEVAQPRSIAFHSELQSSGVTLVYCPHNGKKDVADKMMIVDMLAFALDKPPPAKIVIITGDRDFAYASAILRLRGYETVIISPPNTSHASLKMQADQLFDWQKDVTDPTSPDTSDVVEAVSQSTAVITLEDSEPEVSGTPGTCLPAKSETDTCLSKSVLGDIVESSAIETMDNTGIDAKPSPKETAPSFLKSLSTLFSGAPKSSQVPSLKADALSRPNQPVAFSSKLSNEPGCILSSSLDAQTAGLSVDADRNCSCAICRRSSRVKQDLSGISTVSTVKQSAVANPVQHYILCNQVEDTIDSSTNTPSSVSTVTSSSDTSRSTTSSLANKEPSTTPSPASVLRFRPLINYFIEQRDLTGLTRIRSSTVASELRKHNSMVYENAGVVKLKQYIEEAREATIIISPGLDKEGDGWIEINPSLYPGVKPTSTHKESQLKSSTQIFRPASSSESIETFEQVVDVKFRPLVTCLRMESPDYRLSYSMLGQHLKAQHPFLYEDAGVCNLTQYLQKAVDMGIVRVGNINSPGRQWAELTKRLRCSKP